MVRMHAPGKGISQSALPYRRSVPTWLKLSSGDVKEQIFKLAKKGLKAIRDLNPMVIENFKMSEVEVIKLSAEEKAAFKKATRPAWDARMAKASKDGKRLFDAIMKAKKK